VDFVANTVNFVADMVNFFADMVNFVADMVNFVASVYCTKVTKSTVLNSTLLPVCTGIYRQRL